ncbi:MAG TPA: class I SAM-dependent methyltransferase [Tepidisphaeraceae bacterium]|jgi:SAM-dependent methyltransferase|nr:class I SAM-dependent methyltransferase [Tepidisphaeraceae bacterium]
MRNSRDYNPLYKPKQMLALISEITGEPAECVAERLELERKYPGRNVADDFQNHGGPRYQWGSHLESFYSQTNAFLYELVVWNRNGLKRRMRRWTARHIARANQPIDLLSIGDGLGFDCVYFADKGHRVTYFELPGISERFARRLFELNGSKIPVLTDPNAIPKEAFDAITCFDVLEHVPDPPAMVRTLASYLRPGGVLYVSAPFYMILPWYPTHLRANRQYSGSISLYEEAGLQLIDGHFTWYPLAFQKPPVSQTPGLAAKIARLTGAVQKMGRMAAWPFSPIHLLRRMGNRKT